MPKIVNADALKMEFCTNVCVGAYMDCSDGSEVYFTSREVDKVIDLAPTYDPVVHSGWAYDSDGFARCLECNQKAPVFLQYQDEPETIETDYCPHCGAKMDGET